MMPEDPNYIERLSAKIRSKVDPAKLPDDGLEELFASYAALALSKGPRVTNEDVHDAWSAWATKYAPKSDALVPFNELSRTVQDEDSIFRDAINAVASESK